MLEGQYVNDWIKNFHGKALIYGKMRVGPLPAAGALAGVIRKYPDKIFIENGTVWIVEGKIKPSTAAVGQLKFYADQFPVTPEFYFAKDLPVKKILLTTREDPDVRTFAEKEGLTYEVYLPEWLQKILEARV